MMCGDHSIHEELASFESHFRVTGIKGMGGE